VTEVRKCLFEKISVCEGGLSREHYISRAILRQIFEDGIVTLSGTPWSGIGGKSVSIESLTAKIFCRKHNSMLEKLDAEASRFFGTARQAQIDLSAKICKSATNTFNGDLLERWFLKVIVGMSASNNFAREGKAIKTDLPELWLKILEGQLFPKHWGLYVNPPVGVVELVNRQIAIGSLSDPDGGVRAANFLMAGVPMAFVLGVADNLQALGFFRPSEFNFVSDVAVKKLRMRWSGESSGVPITFSRVKPRN
jgi:hypothetical protein